MAERERRWPAPLGKAAFHGPIGKYVREIANDTEGDPAAILIQALVCAGNAMGRGPHFFVEDTRHGTNLFTCVVGDTSAARKGTSLDRARKLVQTADAEWAIANEGEGGLSTAEGLINAVRDRNGTGPDIDPGVTDKRLLAAMGEFGETLEKMRREGNPLSATLRAAWDGHTLRIRTRNKPLTASGAHVSVIGHITEADLGTLLGRTNIFNGFGNRFLWVMAKRARSLPFGGKLRAEHFPKLVNELERAIVWAEGRERVIDFDAETRKLWPKLYVHLGRAEDGPLGAITDRAEAQVRRLALVYAALDRSPAIKLAHLRAALEVWRYCEDSARYLFGRAVGDPFETRIIRILGSGGWVARSRLAAKLKDPRSYQLTSALDALIERGSIEARRTPTRGRARIEYRAKGGGKE